MRISWFTHRKDEKPRKVEFREDRNVGKAEAASVLLLGAAAASLETERDRGSCL